MLIVFDNVAVRLWPPLLVPVKLKEIVVPGAAVASSILLALLRLTEVPAGVGVGAGVDEPPPPQPKRKIEKDNGIPSKTTYLFLITSSSFKPFLSDPAINKKAERTKGSSFGSSAILIF